MDTYRDRYSSESSEPDPLDEYLNRAESGDLEKKRPEPPDQGKKYVLIAILVIVGFFYFKGEPGFNFTNPVNIFSSGISINQPSEDLLNRMNARMVEMGYTDLSHDDLRDLRRNGVTATYISNIRGLGFTDLTLDEAVRLAQADVSSTFMAMMLELGYDLDIEDFVTLRRAGVTAHYTSNIHDLGYRDVTVEQLIRMQRIGVDIPLIERFKRIESERGEDVSLEEIIRYRISNQ